MGGGPPAEPEQPVPAVEQEPEQRVFTTNELNRELRQSEILSGVAQFIPNAAEPPDAEGRIQGEYLVHPFAVVLTQDCDLLQDFDKRQDGGDGSLASVLLYAAENADDVRGEIKGRDIWKRIIQNNDERYHFLESAAANCDLRNEGIGGLIIDFKSFFTLTPSDIYSQFASGAAQRRCRLEMPYREHLQCRAAYYFQRVVLPVPHKYAEAKKP